MGTRLYPPDHALALARALRVVDIVGAQPSISDDEIVSQLVSEGVGAVDAELLVRLVPEALAWAVFRRLGLAFTPYYSVSNTRGRMAIFLLAEEHYFTAAVAWAESVLNMPVEQRPVSEETFMTTVARSSMNDAANKQLDQHGPDSLRGCVFTAALGGITAEQIRESRRDPNWRWWKFYWK